MGHRNARTFEFYRNQSVKCDVQAAFLGLPSEETLIKAVGQMSLTVDLRAPTELTDEQKKTLAEHPTVGKLRKKRDKFAAAAEAADGRKRDELLER